MSTYTMSDSNDPLEIARRLAEAFRQVRFASGVVGKTSYLTLAIVGIWALVIWRLSDNLVLDAFLVASASIATGAYVWWTRRTHAFATNNPGLALLEGAHLLEYQRFLSYTREQHAPAGESTSHRMTTPDAPDEGGE